MSLAILHSRASLGLSAPLVTIEAHLAKGLPSFSIVGLPEKTVKESRERVRSAITNNGFNFPVKRIVINLAPADLPKEGGRFDLAIAIGILAASDQLPNVCLDDFEFVGELALTGKLNPVKGILSMALAAHAQQRVLILPKDNVIEAQLVSGLNVFAASHLKAVCAFLTGKDRAFSSKHSITPTDITYPDLKEVKGQYQAKRALEIAAAGNHSVLFCGPPGTGKTMLASRLPSILPDMTDGESQETAAVYSISAQGFDVSAWKKRPFRSPHHTASSVALVGGGNPPKPGEISLSHNGVLFLDELPEFNRHVLEALREPLEAGCVTISRASHQAVFPARFQLIAAMNPCPCGYYGDPSGRCHCSHEQVARYQSRLSGPLLDRIDLHIAVMPQPSHYIFHTTDDQAESSDTVKERVLKARNTQLARNGFVNQLLQGHAFSTHCQISPADAQFLEEAVSTLGLSARAYSRILRVARTIADLEDDSDIRQSHLQEALGYRRQNHGLRAI